MIRSAPLALAALLLAGLGAGTVRGDPMAYGRHLARECLACHRQDSAAAAIPAIAGRPAAELVDLLRAYRDGRRTNPVMVSVAGSLEDAQMAALAAYLASLPKQPDAGAPSR